METETVKVSDLKKLIATAHATLCVVLHALDTKVLVGEINRPTDPVTKITRKRRTKKEMKVLPPTDPVRNSPKMNLEKGYQAERHEPLNLPDGDVGSTFYTPKKERKKREKKVPVVE